MNKRLGIAIGALLLLAVGAASAADIAGQVKTRQDFFHGIGGAMKGLNDTLKSPTPAKADLQKYAAILDAQAPKLPGYFPAGTGLDSGVKTGAKPEIWAHPVEFSKDAAALAAAAHKVNLATQDDDQAAIKAAVADLGGTCKACHQTFRSQDH